MSNLMAAIFSLVPGAQCVIPDDDLSQIAWFDERPMPPVNEINEAMVRIEIQNQLSTLETSMHAYIEAHYNTQLKLFFLCLYQDPASSPERKAAIESTWYWAEQVVMYYGTLVTKLVGGTPLTAEEVDFPTLFDATDPKVTMFNLPA